MKMMNSIMKPRMRIKIDFQNYEKDYKSFDILALVTNREMKWSLN